MTTHEHQWVFAGEVVIPQRGTEPRGNEDFHRLEYCIVCGTNRIRFGSTWRFWYSDASKQFLQKFDQEVHKTVRTLNPEFSLEPPISIVSRSPIRLGRGLSDLKHISHSAGISMKTFTQWLKGESNEGKGRS